MRDGLVVRSAAQPQLGRRVTYTVVLRYPDATCGWPDDMYSTPVEADSIDEAILLAQQDALAALEGNDPEHGYSVYDMTPLLVMEGEPVIVYRADLC